MLPRCGTRGGWIQSVEEENRGGAAQNRRREEEHHRIGVGKTADGNRKPKPHPTASIDRLAIKSPVIQIWHVSCKTDSL